MERNQNELKRTLGPLMLWALGANMLVGISALLTGKTGEIITIACFGALTLYILSLITFFKLRVSQPNLHRPFRAGFYPFAQLLALIIAIISFIAMMIFNLKLGLIYFGILLISYVWFQYFISEDYKLKILA